MKDSSRMSYPDLSPFFPFLPDELVGPFAALAVAFLLSLAVVGTLLVVRWGGWPFAPRSAPYFDAVLTLMLGFVVSFGIIGAVLFYAWLADPESAKNLVALDEAGDGSDDVQEHPQGQESHQDEPDDDRNGEQD